MIYDAYMSARIIINYPTLEKVLRNKNIIRRGGFAMYEASRQFFLLEAIISDIFGNILWNKTGRITQARVGWTSVHNPPKYVNLKRKKKLEIHNVKYLYILYEKHFSCISQLFTQNLIVDNFFYCMKFNSTKYYMLHSILYIFNYN